MQSNIEWIKKVMAANGLEAAGPVRIITNEFGAETYSFDVAQPVRKVGATGAATASSTSRSKARSPRCSTSRPRLRWSSFKGHMANLPKVRDALRGWALTRGYETVERPYEAWKAGIAAGFTEEGEFDVYWAVK